MLGAGEDGVRALRQTMLSCTVENKDKTDLPEKFGQGALGPATTAFDSQRMLGLVLEYLEESAERDENHQQSRYCSHGQELLF